jgi:hypothetical protein
VYKHFNSFKDFALRTDFSMQLAHILPKEELKMGPDAQTLKGSHCMLQRVSATTQVSQRKLCHSCGTGFTGIQNKLLSHRSFHLDFKGKYGKPDNM